MIATLIAAAALLSIEAPGAYELRLDGAVCRIVLDAPSPVPEGSLVTTDGASGLVLAFPDCPSGLGEAAFWRADAAGTALTIFDAMGGVLLTAAPDGRRGWSGQTPQGARARLARR
ncbi:MAG: hypothetical protein GC187_05995 [Alphaproteobacteria bacterium]|nr:hypothetical protein [Alphaproteobacteria bacterium]